MTATTRRMRDLTIEDHTISVPLVWGDGSAGAPLWRISVHMPHRWIVCTSLVG